jgi:hypothetical protein
MGTDRCHLSRAPTLDASLATANSKMRFSIGSCVIALRLNTSLHATTALIVTHDS